MDRCDYQEKISALLDEAASELPTDEFEILLSRVEDMVNDYE